MEGFEEDPAAAFLAREQDELADIAADTLGFAPGPSEVRALRFISSCKLLGRLDEIISIYSSKGRLSVVRFYRYCLNMASIFIFDVFFLKRRDFT